MNKLADWIETLPQHWQLVAVLGALFGLLGLAIFLAFFCWMLALSTVYILTGRDYLSWAAWLATPTVYLLIAIELWRGRGQEGPEKS